MGEQADPQPSGASVEGLLAEGRRLIEARRPAEAADVLGRAAEASPGNPRARVHLARALGLAGRRDEAEAQARAAIALDPGAAVGWTLLGTLLEQDNRVAEALAAFREGLAREPSAPAAYLRVALACARLGRGPEAEAMLCAAGRLIPPGPWPTAWCALASTTAKALLVAGDFDRGWAAMAWWVSRAFPPPGELRAWDGVEDLAGRAVVLTGVETGLGDWLQFARFARDLAAKGAAAVVGWPQKLLPLLPADLAALARPAARPTAPPVAVPMSLVPAVLRLSPTQWRAADVPYLQAPDDRVDHWRARLADVPGRKVGIAWWGSSGATDPYAWPARRGIALAEFAPLASVPGVTLVSLQAGEGVEQIPGAGFAVLDPGPDRTLADDAAIMMQLDLIIGADSAPNHLAGALGRPTWAALPHKGDWRWLDGETTPWYPTLRLWRQRRPDDWSDVFRGMADALREGIAECPSSR
jgi:tetratricopeptide (TPR) repeat protein